MIHPDTTVARISPSVGLGVVATRHIPKGTLVWVQDRFDQKVSREEGLSLDDVHRSILDRYAHIDGSGNWILCWDAGRLVNHSCAPSLRGLGPNAMAARHDLHPGTEITCDYAECNIERPLECACGEASCRGFIRALDLLRFARAWDEEAVHLSVYARSLPQPLLPFCADRSAVERLISGACPIPPFATQSPGRAGTPRRHESGRNAIPDDPSNDEKIPPGQYPE